jgi:Flp pilus assembly protein TadB
VPLSEREQKILEEIERDLYREDPSFARNVRTRASSIPRAARTRLGVLLFLAGLASLFVFFAKQWLLLGAIAFIAMVAGVVLVAGSLRSAGEDRSRERMANVVQRWEQRFRQRYKGK